MKCILTTNNPATLNFAEAILKSWSLMKMKVLRGGNLALRGWSGI